VRGLDRLAADEDNKLAPINTRFPMSYTANVIKIMVATPSDVAAERKVIRDVIYEWNSVHSKDKEIVLLPAGWESDASPSMGERPQAIINKQVLKNCDLLIAVFWTRLGSPTGKAASGSVEEIEEHLNAGKPAMIYFSSAPVAFGSVDMKQYEALSDFKKACRQKGLIAEYDSLEDFKGKVSRQLAHTILREFSSKGPRPEVIDGGTWGPKNNFNAAGPPTGHDDSTEGYSKGSTWVG
jgi:hypothetical protein